jgi:hypothetical protein
MVPFAYRLRGRRSLAPGATTRDKSATRPRSSISKSRNLPLPCGVHRVGEERRRPPVLRRFGWFASRGLATGGAAVFEATHTKSLLSQDGISVPCQFAVIVLATFALFPVIHAQRPSLVDLTESWVVHLLPPPSAPNMATATRPSVPPFESTTLGQGNAVTSPHPQTDEAIPAKSASPSVVEATSVEALEKTSDRECGCMAGGGKLAACGPASPLLLAAAGIEGPQFPRPPGCRHPT